jgi:hypothetical protein
MRIPRPFLFLTACVTVSLWANSPVTTELLQGDWLLEQQKPSAGQLHIINRRNAGATPSELKEMNHSLHAIEAMLEGYGQAIEIRGRTLYNMQPVRQFGMALKKGRHFTIKGNALEFDDGSPRILVKVGASSMLHVEPANPAAGKPEIRYLYKRIDRGVRPWTHHVIATAIPADVKVNHQRVPQSPTPSMALGSVAAQPSNQPAPVVEEAPEAPFTAITEPEPPTSVEIPTPSAQEVVEIDVLDIGIPELPATPSTPDPFIEIDVPDLPDIEVATPAGASDLPDIPDLPAFPDFPDIDAASVPADATTAAPDDLSLPPIPAPDAALDLGPPPAFDVPPVIVDEPPATTPGTVVDSAPGTEPPEPDVGLPDIASIDFPEIPGTTEVATPEPVAVPEPAVDLPDLPDLGSVPSLPDVPDLPDLPSADIGAPVIDLPAPPAAAVAEVTPDPAELRIPEIPDLPDPPAPVTAEVAPDPADLALPEIPEPAAIPDLLDLPGLPELPAPPAPATAEVMPEPADLPLPEIPEAIAVPDLPDFPEAPETATADVTPAAAPDFTADLIDLPELPSTPANGTAPAELALPDLPGIPIADTGDTVPAPAATDTGTTAVATPDLDLPSLDLPGFPDLPDLPDVTPAVKSDNPDAFIRANITSLAESQFPDDTGLAWNVQKIKKINGHTYVEVTPKPASVGYDRLVFALSFKAGNPSTPDATYAFEDGKFVLFSTSPDVADGEFAEELRNW